jgi:hypothetical protein
MKPLVSNISDCTLVLLSKNHENFIFQSLNAIDRELHDIKIVCADIGSTDQTFTCIKEISHELKLNSQHISLSDGTKTLTALKTVDKYITTKYVILLSADDVLGENYRAAILDFFSENSEDSVLNFTSVVTDQDLKPIYSKNPSWGSEIEKNKKLLSFCNPGTAPGAVIPWTKLRGTKSWANPPDIIVEDYWIWWQLVESTKFINIHKSHVYYRSHQNNITKASKNENYAHSLGYISALPNTKRNNRMNRLLSRILILRWIRHLNYKVWPDFFIGYNESRTNENI